MPTGMSSARCSRGRPRARSAADASTEDLDAMRPPRLTVRTLLVVVALLAVLAFAGPTLRRRERYRVLADWHRAEADFGEVGHASALLPGGAVLQAPEMER